MRYPVRVGLVIGMIGSLLMSFGCQPEMDPSLMLLDTKLSETTIDDLKKSMDLVRSNRQFEIDEFEDKVNAGLNRWATTEVDSQVDWSLDPMVAEVIEEFSASTSAQQVSAVSFINTDAGYLQSCAWSRLVGERMVESRSLDGFEFYRMAANYQPDSKSEEDELGKIMMALHEGLSQKDGESLAHAVRIFDWIVRNVQLLPEVHYTEAEAADAQLYEGTRASERGLPGLGYQRFPSQVLVYGRGDFAEKAKLFINMLQQVGLDSIVLTFDGVDSEGNPSAVPWCVAVDIGGQLYLFDTKLGMPLPNAKTKGIATLSDVQSDPELLKWLDLTVEESLADDNSYWVGPEQMKTLKGAVLVAPEAISKRMAKLESQFIGKDEPIITIKPSELAAQFKKSSQLEIGVWDVAFDTLIYRQQVKRALNESLNNNRLADRIGWYYTDEAYIDNFAVYRTARSVFLHGQFHSRRGAPRGNAIERFFALMYPPDTIRNLAINQKLQRRHGILKDNQDVANWQMTLKTVQAQMGLIARDTSYFLAQCHFDNGNLGVASIWLDRIKDKANAERWGDGIFYLLGRSLEGNREFDRAIQVYRQRKDSAQVHGSLIRARMLESMLSDEATTP